jgi:hypothetical protein
LSSSPYFSVTLQRTKSELARWQAVVAEGKPRGAAMVSNSPNFDDLRALVRTRAASKAEARKVANDATSAIVDCRTGADLCDELTATLESIEICDWLGQDVGDAMRERAVELVNQIEQASSSASQEVAPANRLVSSDLGLTPPEEGQADFGGPYGYGRPAHKPDPNAEYAFQISAPRVLSPRRHIAPIRLVTTNQTRNG